MAGDSRTKTTTNVLALFLLVHIAMVCLAGFMNQVRTMITGTTAARVEHT